MNFLVDAQLPRRLAHHLCDAGHDTLHTLDLPNRNRTTDEELNTIAEREERVVITKDTDFVNSFLIAHHPRKLLLVSTGNISNTDLESILVQQIATIATEFLTHDFIELTRTAIVIHV
jgi:predicted nuclease of predicted toxin-antitoxin system